MDSPDEPAPLARWFEEFRGPLRRYIALRFRARPADLDDLAQEVFLRLLRYKRADHVNDPRSYLFHVAANVASEWSMRAAQRLPHNASWIEQLAEPAHTEGELERRQRDDGLSAALRRLPARMQQVLRLHFEEGFTHKEIAERLALTPRTVKRDIIESYVRLRADAAVLEISSSEPYVDESQRPGVHR